MDKEQFYKEFFRYLECGSCADLEFCQKQLEPACKTGLAIYRKLKLEDLEKENEQLKCQLAEKEKEVEKWKNKKVKHLVDGLLVDRNLAIQIVEEIREDFRQKSFCNDYHEYIVDMEIFEYFNNKIKSLKGENK